MLIALEISHPEEKSKTGDQAEDDEDWHRHWCHLFPHAWLDNDLERYFAWSNDVRVARDFHPELALIAARLGIGRNENVELDRLAV